MNAQQVIITTVTKQASEIKVGDVIKNTFGDYKVTSVETDGLSISIDMVDTSDGEQGHKVCDADYEIQVIELALEVNESVADDTSTDELSVEQRIELAWRDADLAELASLGEPIAPEHVVTIGKFATSAYRFINQLAKAGNVEAQEFVRDANKLQYLPGDAPIYAYRHSPLISFSKSSTYEIYNVITDEIHPDYTQLDGDDASRTVYHLNKQSSSLEAGS